MEQGYPCSMVGIRSFCVSGSGGGICLILFYDFTYIYNGICTLHLHCTPHVNNMQIYLEYMYARRTYIKYREYTLNTCTTHMQHMYI